MDFWCFILLNFSSFNVCGRDNAIVPPAYFTIKLISLTVSMKYEVFCSDSTYSSLSSNRNIQHIHTPWCIKVQFKCCGGCQWHYTRKQNLYSLASVSQQFSTVTVYWKNTVIVVRYIIYPQNFRIFLQSSLSDAISELDYLVSLSARKYFRQFGKKKKYIKLKTEIEL